jgi:hypothetical protein
MREAVVVGAEEVVDVMPVVVNAEVGDDVVTAEVVIVVEVESIFAEGVVVGASSMDPVVLVEDVVTTRGRQRSTSESAVKSFLHTRSGQQSPLFEHFPVAEVQADEVVPLDVLAVLAAIVTVVCVVVKDVVTTIGRQRSTSESAVKSFLHTRSGQQSPLYEHVPDEEVQAMEVVLLAVLVGLNVLDVLDVPGLDVLDVPWLDVLDVLDVLVTMACAVMEDVVTT